MIIEDYENPFDALLDFEDMLSEYTGAPYVVLTDCCTHALELCLRHEYTMWDVTLPARTYLSIPMMLKKINKNYFFKDIDWEEDGEYDVIPSVYDSARLFEEGMFRPREKQCLSFGHGKPLQIGAGGAILLDNADDYATLKRMAYDGRNIHTYDKWADQNVFDIGYHYHMRPEWAIKGMRMLDDGDIKSPPPFNYPDLRDITING